MVTQRASSTTLRAEPAALPYVPTRPPVHRGGRLLRRDEVGGDEGEVRDTRVAGPGNREEADALAQAWFGLSVFLKEQCGGSTAAVLCGNPEASQALRLKASARHPVTVGGVDCRLLVYGIKGRQREGAPAEAGGGGGAAGAATSAEQADCRV